MYILDTNVISELRKAKSKKANKNVKIWAADISASSMYLSVITVLELEVGILLLERRDKAQGAMLRTWLNKYVLPAFAGRILSIDLTVAQHCAKLHVPNPKSQRDALIAATALTHGMTVVTRNIIDFQSMKVSVYNPWN